MKRTLIQNARVFNTWLKQFIPGWLLIEDGRIRYAFLDEECPKDVNQVIDAEGCFCIPSLIDIHLHIESSMMTPAGFSRALLRNGVTTCVAEPHEIANVMGYEGVEEFIHQGRECQADILWGIPSSVPCSPYETTGGRIELADALELTKEADVACLGEVMNCYSVLHEPNGKIRQWLECLRREHPNLTREGHISYYKGAELCDIAYHGVDSDHTSVGLDYFIERLKMGVFGDVQDKSLLPEVVGMKPERAITVTTWTPARRMKLYDRGMLAPGMKADLILLKNLEDFDIRLVMKNGEIAYDVSVEEKPLPQERRFPEKFYESVHLPELTLEDFIIHTTLPDGPHTARTMVPEASTAFVREGRAEVMVKDGRVDYDNTPHCVIAVFDRYTGKANRMLGLTDGPDFIKEGAVACTYAHDHHNLLVAGKTAAECQLAANWVIAHQGGYCMVEHGEVVATLPLEVGVIVSEAPLADMAVKAKAITETFERMGSQFETPIMSYSVLGLTVAPFLRITDKGYVDTKKGLLLPLFDEEK